MEQERQYLHRANRTKLHTTRLIKTAANSQSLVKEVRSRKYHRESLCWDREYDNRLEDKALELQHHITLQSTHFWRTLSSPVKVWMASGVGIRQASLISWKSHLSSKRLQSQKQHTSYSEWTRSFRTKEMAQVKHPTRPMSHHRNSRSPIIMAISIFRKEVINQRLLELNPTWIIQISALDLGQIVITKIKRTNHHCNPMGVKSYSRRQMVHT